MERNYFYKTKRIGFSKWSEADAALAKALWGNADVTRYICATGIFLDADIQKRLEVEIKNDEKHGVQYWPIFELKTGDFIGCCGLRPHSDADYEIGFHLLPNFWGKGMSAEAALGVMEYAAGQMKVKTLFAGHSPKNLASEKVLKKLGFEYVRDEFYAPAGMYHPSYIKTFD